MDEPSHLPLGSSPSEPIRVQATDALTSTAASTVLGLPELVTKILMYTDVRTLLTSAQRVNRKWHWLVANTASIQCRLFFLAWKPPPRPQSHVEVVWNPFIGEMFPTWFDGFMPESFYHREVPSERTVVAYNRCAALYSRASWRRMLVGQPPTTLESHMKSGEFWGCPDIQTLILHLVGPHDDPDDENVDYLRGPTWICRCGLIHVCPRAIGPVVHNDSPGVRPDLRMGSLFNAGRHRYKIMMVPWNVSKLPSSLNFPEPHPFLG